MLIVGKPMVMEVNFRGTCHSNTAAIMQVGVNPLHQSKQKTASCKKKEKEKKPGAHQCQVTLTQLLQTRV